MKPCICFLFRGLSNGSGTQRDPKRANKRIYLHCDGQVCHISLHCSVLFWRLLILLCYYETSVGNIYFIDNLQWKEMQTAINYTIWNKIYNSKVVIFLYNTCIMFWRFTKQFITVRACMSQTIVINIYISSIDIVLCMFWMLNWMLFKYMSYSH